jgi:hypothetical protein
MLQKLTFSLVLLVLTASTSIAQSRTLYIGDVGLSLGMSRETVMRLLSKYNLLVIGATGFAVREYDQKAKDYDVLGSVGFENDVLTYITREMDTTAWPNDEGFAVGRAIYDAVNGSIPLTDSDGAKRANVTMVIASQEVDRPVRGNLKTINMFINNRKVVVSIWDGTDGRHANASVSIRSKPW